MHSITAVAAHNMYLFADNTTLIVSQKNRYFLKIETFVQSGATIQWLSDNIVAIQTKNSLLFRLFLKNNYSSAIYARAALFDDLDLSQCYLLGSYPRS